MRKQYDHQLTIKQFADFFRLDPFHVAGFCSCQTPDVSGCVCSGESEWLEYDSSANTTLTRQALSWAIHQAEGDLTDLLNAYPIARYVEGEKQDYNFKDYKRRDGRPHNLFLHNGRYLQRMGKRTRTLLGTATVTIGVPITKREHLFTAVTGNIIPSGTTADELILVYDSADRLDSNLDHWIIEPYESVNIVGQVATFHIPAYLLADPQKLADAEDGETCLYKDEEDSYVDQVEVWRVTYDPCEQGIIYGFEGGEGCGDNPCEEVTYSACFPMTDYSLGEVVPRLGTCEDDLWSLSSCPVFSPRYAITNFVAGYRAGNDQIVAAICYLAASKLNCDAPSCGCDECTRVKRLSTFSRVPKVKIGEGNNLGGEGDSYTVMVDKTKPYLYPLGMTEGAILSFARVQNLA